MELLEQLTDVFIAIYERSPARLKNKLSSTIKDLTTSARSVSIRYGSRLLNGEQSSKHFSYCSLSRECIYELEQCSIYNYR